MGDVPEQLGKPQEALKLYEQSLPTVRNWRMCAGIAVTQSSMGDVLRQLGKPQEALKLYEQSLAAFEELEDVRGIAVTQSSMGDVLRQLGKPQEALKLYEQSLAAMRGTGGCARHRGDAEFDGGRAESAGEAARR